MKSYQVTKYEGENVGRIDWSYNFWSHFSCYCSNDEVKRGIMERQIANLFECERRFLRGERLQVRNGDYWHDVLDVGMYDGWPYWKPVPSVCESTAIGGFEWHQFPRVDELRVKVERGR